MGKLWANRIVGYGEEAPDQLLANPRNFRIHPKPQQDALLGVLREVGVVQDVLVNKSTGFVVDGHLRISLALREKQTTIPVKYVELSEDEEALILATLDPLAALAATDKEKLDALLHDVSTGDAVVQGLLADMAIKAGIVPGVNTDDLWKGMPDFEQENIGGWKSIIIHFDTEDDYHSFARLINQTLTPQTKSVWYPERPERLRDQLGAGLRYITDES
jgi:hypothetical protein